MFSQNGYNVNRMQVFYSIGKLQAGSHFKLKEIIEKKNIDDEVSSTDLQVLKCLAF